MLQPLQGAFRPINCYRLILEELYRYNKTIG